MKTKNAEKEEKGETKNAEKDGKGETKDAEKDGKEEEKIGEGRKKQWLRGSFNGKIVPLCLDMCLLAQEQWKTYFKQFRKKENRWIIKMMTNNPEQAFLKVYVTSKKETKSLRCKR